jgi:hypothetical protein
MPDAQLQEPTQSRWGLPATAAYSQEGEPMDVKHGCSSWVYPCSVQRAACSVKQGIPSMPSLHSRDWHRWHCAP